MSLGMGKKLSLTNLTQAVGQESTTTTQLSSNDITPEIHTSSSLSSTQSSNLINPNTTIITTPSSSSNPLLQIHSSTLGSTTTSPTPSPPSLNNCTTSSHTDTDTQQQQQQIIYQDPNPRASTITTDTAMTLLASPFNSSSSLSSILHGDTNTIQSATNSFSVVGSTVATQSTTSKTMGSKRPQSISSVTTVNTTTASTTKGIPKGNNSSKLQLSSPSTSSAYPRSRATNILLNLESSSNDARFQEILHNTIALDHFRQFCFQEYSIENLLFWMDVELFAKPNPELLQVLKDSVKTTMQQGQQDDGCETVDNEKQDNNNNNNDHCEGESCSKLCKEQFAIQQARYIYLTYIDPCGPLQVNISEETRTNIPWPILDHNHSLSTIPPTPTSAHSSVASSPRTERRLSIPWVMGSSNNNNNNNNNSNSSKDSKRREEPVVVGGRPLDRHMFDGAQEHTYQLMKGHTLVRFEQSELWRQVQKIKREEPEKYALATIKGPLNSYYKLDASVIVSTVTRSRSRHPSARPSALYNWNNSTTDLNRSRDKEEALAKAMSQYFGPIPSTIRHKAPLILGLGRADEDSEDGLDDFDHYNRGLQGRIARIDNNHNLSSNNSKRSSTSSTGVKKNRFTRHFSGGIHSVMGKTLASTTDDIMEMCHDEPFDVSEIDSVENGKRTTRWMVAGYFNDKVRLTAAQRKRLLRRNNKLTKFFGSRVDGTLRPVEELVEGGLGFGQFGMGVAGSNSIPGFGSPLAYALSSSIIHDMDENGKGNRKKSINKGKRNTLGERTSSSEQLLPPGNHAAAGSKTLLQRFKKNSNEPDDNNHKTSNSTPTSPRRFFSYNGKGKDKNNRHHRSTTSSEVQQPRRIFAHPHPLWSGSLSDQEGVASTNYERRRGLSILSVMGNNNTPGAVPITPTNSMPGLFSTLRGNDQDGSISRAGGGSLDRFDMPTRRKKADKLSTFFGAQLTTQELSSQLPMENDLNSNIGKSGISNNRKSNETQSTKANGPAVSSVNQLSKEERSVLWKRNKKLRGILGETLPESDVAFALTRPVLMGAPKLKINGQGSNITTRRTGAANRLLRRKRTGSLSSRQELRPQDIENNDSDENVELNQSESEGSDKENLDDTFNGSNTFNSNTSSGKSKGKGRAARRIPARLRRPSVVSISSRKSQTRLTRGSIAGLNRSKSMDSLMTLDSLLAATILDMDIEDEEDEIGDRSPGSPKSNRRKLSTYSSAFNINALLATGKSPYEAKMGRFHRKKRMDKIHQFLGDRIPDQDLWMGTVGRVKTQEMMDLNLLSPTSSTGTGGSSPSSFRKHGFQVIDKGKNYSAGNMVGPTGTEFKTLGSGTTMKRSLTNPESYFSRKSEVQQYEAQPSQNWHSTARKIRQQLVSPASSPPSTQSGSMSGIGQLLAESNTSPSQNLSGASPTLMPTMSPLYMSAPTSLKLVQDDEEDLDNEADGILPKLRAMSEQDQERFLKRAEKLEKLFGHFPPSSLMLNNSNNGSQNSDTALGFSEGEVVNNNGNGNDNDNDKNNGNNEKEEILDSSGKKKSQQQQQQSERSSVNTVESLVISETQFSCEL
ncbi:hypothetical protein BGZ46_009823 [Entomortierella lignicola]|nr:hypothetical protein BGZ46_009823 [Entomortierella lignicola]